MCIRDSLKSLYSDNYTSKHEIIIESQENGYISSMDTEKIGWALVEIGCGRKVAKDALDNSGGIKFNRKVGDRVNVGDPVYKLFNSNEKKLYDAKSLLLNTFTISREKTPKQKLIINT